MKKQKVIYITDCGDGQFCELTDDEIHITNYGKWKLCPNHGGKIVQRKTWCVDCGKEFYAKIHGYMPERCQPCRKKRHREHSKMRNRERRQAKNDVSPGYIPSMVLNNFYKKNFRNHPLQRGL